MKNFRSWGTKIRSLKDYNYQAIWNNLVTMRIGGENDEIIELPPDLSEFYDVGITTKCNLECPFCYVSAGKGGEHYSNISETWRNWMQQFPEERFKNVTRTLKPFQIAIGSVGEPTLSPEFTDFLQTVYETNVVPNYTTNGVILSDYDNPLCQKILEYTKEYVGGVAVSFGNVSVRILACRALENLFKYGDCRVMIHHIITGRESVNEFVKVAKIYGDDIHYHVLLPMMASGRSHSGLHEGAFEYLEEQILKNNIKNIAFGAHFFKYLENSKLNISVYPQEAYSKNILLKDNKVIITPSSFNLTPIKTIEL